MLHFSQRLSKQHTMCAFLHSFAKHHFRVRQVFVYAALLVWVFMGLAFFSLLAVSCIRNTPSPLSVCCLGMNWNFHLGHLVSEALSDRRLKGPFNQSFQVNICIPSPVLLMICGLEVLSLHQRWKGFVYIMISRFKCLVFCSGYQTSWSDNYT